MTDQSSKSGAGVRAPGPLPPSIEQVEAIRELLATGARWTDVASVLEVTLGQIALVVAFDALHVARPASFQSEPKE